MAALIAKQHELEIDYVNLKKENESLKEDNQKLVKTCDLLMEEWQNLKEECENLKEKNRATSKLLEDMSFTESSLKDNTTLVYLIMQL